jgi:hypothetical protein
MLAGGFRGGFCGLLGLLGSGCQLAGLSSGDDVAGEVGGEVLTMSESESGKFASVAQRYFQCDGGLHVFYVVNYAESVIF